MPRSACTTAQARPSTGPATPSLADAAPTRLPPGVSGHLVVVGRGHLLDVGSGGEDLLAPPSGLGGRPRTPAHGRAASRGPGLPVGAAAPPRRRIPSSGAGWQQ